MQTCRSTSPWREKYSLFHAQYPGLVLARELRLQLLTHSHQNSYLLCFLCHGRKGEAMVGLKDQE